MICPKCKKYLNVEFKNEYQTIHCNKCLLKIQLDNLNEIRYYMLYMVINNKDYELSWNAHSGNFSIYYLLGGDQGYDLIFESKNIPYDITEERLKLILTFQ